MLSDEVAVPNAVAVGLVIVELLGLGPGLGDVPECPKLINKVITAAMPPKPAAATQKVVHREPRHPDSFGGGSQRLATCSQAPASITAVMFNSGLDPLDSPPSMLTAPPKRSGLSADADYVPAFQSSPTASAIIADRMPRVFSLGCAKRGSDKLLWLGAALMQRLVARSGNADLKVPKTPSGQLRRRDATCGIGRLVDHAAGCPGG